MSRWAFEGTAIFISFLLITCSHCWGFRNFPTESEVHANLRPGMTVDQVLALFGEPFSGRPEMCTSCRFRYLAPTGLRTVQRKGYQGFEVQFDEGRVRTWRAFYGFPSYDATALEPPRAFKWWLIGWPLTFIVGFIVAFFRGIPLALTQRARMLRAFVGMKIPPKLPPDFAFITHDTTFHEIIQRSGPCTRELEFAVRSEELHDYPLIRTKKGAPGIRTFVYELPYSSLIVMPEYPFETESRTRAVYRWQGHMHI